MRKTKAEALKTREELLLSALDTFYERGISRASLNEIAQTAGVTRDALYWHFKNKEALFEALFQRISDEVTQETLRDIEAQSPDIWLHLQQSLNNTFACLESNDVYYKFFHILYLKCEHTEQNHSIIDILRRYQTLWSDQILAVINIGLQQHTLPPQLNPTLASIYLQSTVVGLMTLWLRNTENFELSSVAPKIIEASLSVLKQCPALQNK